VRKLFWRLHSVAGLLAGLGLVVVGLTGSVLVFHEELDALFRPAQTRVQVSGPRLPLETLVARVEREAPGRAVVGWDLKPHDPGAADGVFVMPFGTRDWQYLTIDPYTGRLLCQPQDYRATFKGWLLELHKELFLKDAGVLITGLLGAALCFLGLSGLYLYRRFWKTLFRLRLKASFRMISGDFHRLVGVWSTGFNLLLGFTGAYWNLGNVVEYLKKPHAVASDEVLFYNKLFPADLPIQEMLTRAEREIPGFETHYVSLPWAPGGPFTLWGKKADAAWIRSPHGSQVAFDSSDAHLLSTNDITRAGWWQQTVDTFKPLHFGNFGGIPSKIFWSLGGLTPAMLCLSGMSIWWQRRKLSIRKAAE